MGVNPCYEEGYNYRQVVVINKGAGYAPPTTMVMTWLGYDAGVFCIKFFGSAVKGLAPGESVAIWVDPGTACYQYSKGSTVHFFLDYYDAIFMLPSGFGTMNEQQKKELLAYVHDEGKGLIVGHATGVAFTDWPEFGEMVGGYMDSEFNANARVIVEDPQFPGAMAWGAPTFMFNDQHPVFKAPYSRDKVHVIMRLDPESLSAADRARRPDGDFPVVWARQYGKGRMFNVGWGHPETTWDDPHFQTMMLEGIKWAMGVTTADVTPRPLAKSPTPQAAPQAGVAQSAAKDPLPDDVGKSTVLKLCGECHAVQQAVSVKGTEKDWRDMVDLMIERGANGSPEEFQTVINYLSKHFRPKH